MGLNVHQNYLKVMIGQIQEAKRKSNAEVEIDVINRMFEAAKSMSDFAVAEEAVRSQQSWQVR